MLTSFKYVRILFLPLRLQGPSQLFVANLLSAMPSSVVPDSLRGKVFHNIRYTSTAQDAGLVEQVEEEHR